MSSLVAPKPQPTTAPVPQQPTPVLTALHRCDRCGAQAYARFEMPGSAVTGAGDVFGEPLSGDPMSFDLCAHHKRQHEDALAEQGFALVVDETARLDTANKAFKGADA